VQKRVVLHLVASTLDLSTLDNQEHKL
jgi:hypothetical protein